MLVSWQAGDRHDRKIILLIAAAAIATTVVHVVFATKTAIATVFGIDLLLLLAVARYALSCERYWPLWFAGFHAAALAISLTSLLLSADLSWVVLRLGSFWSVAALAAMTIGLLLDRRNDILV